MCTPEFKKKLKRFERLSEDEEESRMAAENPEDKKDELTDAEKQKPMTKGDKVELFEKLKEFIDEKQKETSDDVMKVVSELKTEITKQTNELNEVRKEVQDMKKRIEELENAVVNTADAIEKRIKENGEKHEKRKALENKIRAEIDEEEKRLLIIGFPITVKEHGALVPGLIAAMIRENVTPREEVSIVWIKEAVNGKRSLILLNKGMVQNRDWILMNLKREKELTVKKSFPKLYDQAQRKLNEVGHALREMHDRKINTELWYEGLSLCLMYRMKRKEGDKYEEWIKHSEVDPTEEEMIDEIPKKDVKMDGTSMFVNLNENVESEAVLKKTMFNSLKDHNGEATFKVMLKKQIGIYFQNLNVSKNAEEALMDILKNRARITRI